MCLSYVLFLRHSVFMPSFTRHHLINSSQISCWRFRERNCLWCTYFSMCMYASRSFLPECCPLFFLPFFLSFLSSFLLCLLASFQVSFLSLYFFLPCSFFLPFISFLFTRVLLLCFHFSLVHSLCMTLTDPSLEIPRIEPGSHCCKARSWTAETARQFSN